MTRRTWTLSGPIGLAKRFFAAGPCLEPRSTRDALHEWLWSDCVWREATTGVDAGGRRLELNPFSHIQGVVHLNPEISDGAFQFGMTEQS
jgi:hypothetical protein